jgi:hypothetical protein
MADARESSPELWSVRANRMQLGSPMAGSRGWLTLTATELRYGLGRPSRLLGSRLMGFGTRYFGLFASEPSWTTPVDGIARIDVVDRTPIAPTAPRRFLRILLKNGHEELFLSMDAESRTAASLKEAIRPYRQLD